MFKRLFLASLILLGFISVTYPSNKENTKLFDYCYSFENIISRNLIKKRKTLSGKVKSISNNISEFGVSKTKGALVKKIIEEYKTSNDSLVINLLPNEIYCLVAYWIERINPGKFESILFEKSQTKIRELKKFKEEVEILIKELNSDYGTLIDQLYKAFD